MNFTLENIRKQFDEKTLIQGKEDANKGYVQQIQIAGNQINSRVGDSANQTYQQNILLSSTKEGVHFQGKCSCPIKENCKHIAAVLLTLLHKQKTDANKAKPTGLPPVSAPIASWIQKLQNAVTASNHSPIAPEPNTADKTFKRLLYILSPGQSDKRIFLSLSQARLRQNGEISSASPINDPQNLLTDRPDYLQPDDDEPIRLFIAMRSGIAQQGHSVAEPRGRIGAQLLRLLVERKQLLWTNSWVDVGKGLVFPLRAAPTREACLVWSESESALRLTWEFVPPPADESTNRSNTNRRIDYILPTDPVWYMDNLSCGELILPLDNSSVSIKEIEELIAQAPPISQLDKTAVSHLLITKGLSHIIPPPEPLKESVRNDIRPTPILRLGSVLIPSKSDPSGPETSTYHDYAQLLFDYDGQQASFGTNSPIVRTHGAGVERIERNPKTEEKYRDLLRTFGFLESNHSASPLSAVPSAFELTSQANWIQFTKEELSSLVKKNWRIEKTAEYRYDLAEVESWYAKVEEKNGEARPDWFNLELGIVVNNRHIPLLPILITLIRNSLGDFEPKRLALYDDNDPLLMMLPDGTRVALPWGRIKLILGTLGELYFVDQLEPSICMHALDSARLAELDHNLPLQWMNGESLLEMGKKLSAFNGVEKVAPPATLKATLRDYQNEGLSWMQFLREYNLAGILADDMGLGKTLQTLSHILLEKEEGRLTKPALVVTPTSLVSNWHEEATRFTPSLRVLLLQGKDRAKRFERIDQFDIVLTTYALLPRDEQDLQEHEYHLLILDESQYIKNTRSKAAQIASELNAKHRLCLTGTPLENHLGELWSQFHFLLPGLLGNERVFNSDFRHPIEKLSDENRRALLVRRIRPFLLRRTKDKVAKELPPKTEVVRNVELTSTQRDLYETVRLAMDKKVREEIAKKGIARSQIIILKALLKLRQVCCDPRLVKGVINKKTTASSAKLVELMGMVDELLLEDRRILIFSQFTSMLALIEAELNARNISYALLTGDTIDRAAAVKSFQQGTVPIFLISLKAGGVGLNLTAADTVIHYDPWWNPAVENQATDRAWRIGQDKPVFVYKLIAKGTLEEKIQALQQKKADLAYAMLSTEQMHNVQITPEDLQAIFEPLEENHDEELIEKTDVE